MSDQSFAALGFILVVACLVATVSRRVRLPYSVGLVAAGILIAFLPVRLDLPLTRELIFNVILPPLVFEAALQLRWKQFADELPVTVTLAFVGVPVAASVVALGMHALLHWTWLGAALFGSLIAATDPVAVIASFRELKVESRLSMLVEAESLLNDGTAAVGFGILLGYNSGDVGGASAVAWALVSTVIGGVACGALVVVAPSSSQDPPRITSSNSR